MNAAATRSGRAAIGGAMVLLAVALVWPTPAVAQTGPLGAVRVTVARANLRLEPSLDAMVLTQVTEDTILSLQAIEGDWFKVRFATGGVQIEAYISSIVAERVDAADPVETGQPASAGPAEVFKGMSVSLQVTSGSQGVPPVSTRRLVMARAGGSLTTIGAALPASDAPAPEVPAGAQVTYAWFVEDVSTAPVVSAPRPRLIAEFAQVEGLEPADLTVEIVRLVEAGEARRVVAAVDGRADQASWGDKDWDVMRNLSQQEIRTDRERLGPGTVRIQPTEILAPGAYGVVVRPSSDDPLAGFDVLSDRREGALFAVVWVFTVG